MFKRSEVEGIASLIQEAEHSVKDIKDPQMKLIAFGEVIKFLLWGRSQTYAKRFRKKTLRTTGTAKLRKSKKDEGTMRWLEELKEEKYFEKPKNTKEILTALGERGHHLKPSDLTWPLQECTKRRILRRKKMTPVEGRKPVWHYSNW
ncbi:MAG: hypothetical protein AB1478_00750 [Nitrospirota bacterium]